MENSPFKSPLPNPPSQRKGLPAKARPPVTILAIGANPPDASSTPVPESKKTRTDRHGDSTATPNAPEPRYGNMVRAGVELNAEQSLELARLKGPHPSTRIQASRRAELAYAYAIDIDERRPNEVTRKGALKDPEYAQMYAENVDRGPRDDTRTAACQDPECAVYYAQFVDKGYHPMTMEAASRDPEAKREYENLMASWA